MKIKIKEKGKGTRIEEDEGIEMKRGWREYKNKERKMKVKEWEVGREKWEEQDEREDKVTRMRRWKTKVQE